LGYFAGELLRSDFSAEQMRVLPGKFGFDATEDSDLDYPAAPEADVPPPFDFDQRVPGSGLFA
jgi:hypothetical protein